jgi:Ran GTPase-activating protein (RanGAP) involved in mRNA processing and transport
MNNCGFGVKSPAFLGMVLIFNPKLKLRKLFLNDNDIHHLGLK